MSLIEVPMGASHWSFDVPEGCLTTVQPKRLPGEPIADPRAAVRAALDRPERLTFPLRQAFTPNDRVALVIDEQLPHLGELVAGVLEYLAVAGIGPEAVTILTQPGPASTAWIDDLPDEFADVHTESHQSDDRKLLSYLAATKTGRRVYLNRTLIDADQIVCLSGRRFDPLLGYAGGEGSLYPAFSDRETRRATAEWLTMEAPEAGVPGLRDEVSEIVWLIGAPIFIQVIEGADDTIAHISAGMLDHGADGVRLLNERWQFSIRNSVDVVLAGVGGQAAHRDFAGFARAAATAARVVKTDGVVVLLSDAEPFLGEGMEMLRQCDDYSKALRLIHEKEPIDMAIAFQWVNAATHARLYLASGLRPETVEELFATPILSPGEVQRLLDLGGTCLYLPDADKSLVTIE